MRRKHKFKVGQKVIYEGLIGIIESRDFYVNGEPCYDLVAEEDNEMSCTASEDECELLENQEFDQTEALSKARANSLMIQTVAGRITDKYYRDGNH